MRCPTCNHYFRQFASWRLALNKPIVCPECGTRCWRKGRLMTVVIVVAVLVAFNQLIGMVPFTRFGMLLLVAAMVLVAMWLDERTITLVADGDPAAPAPAEPSEDAKKD